MRRLLLATVSTLTAFAFVAPTLSKSASAQLFEDTPPAGADPSVTDDRSGLDQGYQEGYDAGYQDAMSGSEYDSTYEGYNDDDTIEAEVGGVSRDGSEEGLNPEFEEAFEENLFDSDTVEAESSGVSQDSSEEGLNPEFEEEFEENLFEE